MNGGVPYQGIRGLNFLRSLGGRDCLWGAVQLRKAHVEPSSPFRPPPLLSLTFCLLPVGGGAQVHLRRHGQGGPGAHPTSPPHRRCRPSPNSRRARRAGAVGAQGRRGAARAAAGSPGTRRGAGPGARGAEQLPRHAQLCQAAGHSALQRHERAARDSSPPTWTLITVLGRVSPLFIPEPGDACQPAATCPEPADRAARKPRRAAGHPGTCSPGRRMGHRTRIHTCASRGVLSRSWRQGSRAREPLPTHLGSRRVSPPPGASFRAGPAAANFLVRGVCRPCPDPGPPLSPSPPPDARHRTRRARRSPRGAENFAAGDPDCLPAGHIGSTPHPPPCPQSPEAPVGLAVGR